MKPEEKLRSKILRAEQRAAARAEKSQGRSQKREAWRPDPDAIAGMLQWANRPVGLPLESYAARLYSQHGEDGMVAEVFRRVGTKSRQGAEICAGANGGNAGALASGAGWRCLFVDGDESLVESCRRLHPSSLCVHTFVTRENVNELLESHGFREIDYLGLDLDGVDYHIWEALQVRPRLVVAEFNPLFGPEAAVTIPYERDFSRKRQGELGRYVYPKGYFGVSIAGLAALAKRKGYELVGSAPDSTNAFFVRADLASVFRPCRPADAWRAGKPGKGRERRRRAVMELGVLKYFEAQGYPLIEVS